MTDTPSLRARLDWLLEKRDRMETEIAELQALLASPPMYTRRSRNKPPECGTESGYQRHFYYKDTATDERRVTCPDCLRAHAAAERLAAARRRLKQAS